jgi:hypothetical protein
MPKVAFTLQKNGLFFPLLHAPKNIGHLNSEMNNTLYHDAIQEYMHEEAASH